MLHKLICFSILISLVAVYAWDPTFKFTTRKILYRTNPKPPKLILCYRYHTLKKAIQESLRKKDPIELTIIDIRDRNEVNQTGTVPTAINIPVEELYGALNLSITEFNETYHAEKPRWHRKLVIMSKHGREGLECCEEVLKYNYTRVGNYHDGWADWYNRTWMVGMSLDWTWNPDAWTLQPINRSNSEQEQND
ncbi:uncharacterized protein LOC135832976 [Planococcus citri]|uniref:uncharacterized protein LOC135832976 n=1 Tax=Planococcus citri TaxID=170843 RepID=UPI0031FA0CB3